MGEAVADFIPVEIRLDASWLRAVDKCAKELHFSREQFILIACQEFIERIDARELERIYCERLKEQPEEMDWAEAGAVLAGKVLPQEDW